MVSSIDNYFVMKLWVHEDQMDSQDIDRETEGDEPTRGDTERVLHNV
jgi:hypothetical protein